jgi:hypothetical protein
VRRRAIAALCVGVVVAGLSWFGQAARRARLTPAGPFLIVAHAAQGLSAAALLDRVLPASSDHRSGAAQLALASLTAEERSQLAAALGELTAQLHARMNPLAIDMTEAAQGEQLSKLFPGLLPSWTAAAALSAGRWSAGDGSLAVAVAASCPAALPDKLDCIPAWSEETQSGRELSRVRFLAWPVAGAILLRASSAAIAGQLAAALRQRAPRDTTRIALVLGYQELQSTRTEPEELSKIRAQAGRAAAMVRNARHASLSILEELGRPAAPEPPLPWLALDPDEVLVIPRLRAAADLRPFVREVQDSLAAMAIEPSWLARPGN